MRLIDLDDDRHTYCGDYGDYERWSIDPNVPVVDAVPVIRCKDCRYFHSETHIRDAYPYSLEDGAKITVTKTECTAHELTIPRETDFCSRAEPKQR